MDKNERNWKQDIDRVARQEKCNIREGADKDSIHPHICNDNVCKNSKGEYHYRYDVNDTADDTPTEDFIDDAHNEIKNLRSGGGLGNGALRSNATNVRNTLHNKMRRDIDRINDIQGDLI